MTLQDLLHINKVSIYCIINETNKKIHIVYTRNTISSVFQSMQRIKEGSLCNGDSRKLQFKVIETYTKKNNLYMKYRVEELHREFEQLGYTFYTAYKPLQWKMYYRVGIDDPDSNSVQYKAIVKIKTSENFVYKIRVYDSIEEAKAFVASNTIGSAVRLL